mgnify:FL=1
MNSRLVCKHSERNENEIYSKCKLGLFNGSPNITDCMSCPSYEGKVRGLGDIVAKATKTFGIKPCGSCNERQKKLNKLAPLPCKECKKNKQDK